MLITVVSVRSVNNLFLQKHRLQMTRVQKRLADLVDTAQALENESLCGICTAHAANTVLSPCGHCYCCREECGSLKAIVCPTCRRPVEGRIRLFLDIAPLAGQLRYELSDVVTAIGAGGLPAPLAGKA